MLPSRMFAAEPCAPGSAEEEGQPDSPCYPGLSLRDFRVELGFPFLLPHPPSMLFLHGSCLHGTMSTRLASNSEILPPASSTASQVLELKAHTTVPTELPYFLSAVTLGRLFELSSLSVLWVATQRLGGHVWVRDEHDT